MVALTDLMIAAGLTSTQGQAVGCSASSGVGHRQEGENGTHDDGGSASATSANQGVALVVIRLHGNSGQSQVSAVDTDKGSLGQSSTRVGVLDHGMDADDRDD